jgi:hypothetical protein
VKYRVKDMSVSLSLSRGDFSIIVTLLTVDVDPELEDEEDSELEDEEDPELEDEEDSELEDEESDEEDIEVDSVLELLCSPEF